MKKLRKHRPKPAFFKPIVKGNNPLITIKVENLLGRYTALKVGQTITGYLTNFPIEEKKSVIIRKEGGEYFRTGEVKALSGNKFLTNNYLYSCHFESQ